MKVLSGGYYLHQPDGTLAPVTAAVPDFVICRRVGDFPANQPPASASIAPCATCGELIAFNPQGLYRDRPRICLQCADVEPLPIELT
jgi:hypothetical protein